MKLRIILLIALLTITALVLAQACSQTGTSSTASSTSKSDFASETRVEVDNLEVKPAMKSNDLNIKKMNLDTGKLTFRLFTPNGDLQWEEAFTAPANYKKIHTLEAIPGTWRLEIEIENATGNYDIQWQASN